MRRVQVLYQVYALAAKVKTMLVCEVITGHMYVGMTSKISLIKTVWFLVSFIHVSGIDERDIDLILRAHNNIRRSIANGNELGGIMSSDMKKMVWSLRLQREAEASLDCNNNIARPADPTQVHTNIGVSSDHNITRLIGSWIDEKRNLRMGLGYPTCVNLLDCSRFLKMINSRHRRIGCAFTSRCKVRSQNVNLLVCKYDGGQIIVPPFNQGLPCTGCDTETSFCENGLCVPCNASSSSCDCRKTCNKPNIGSGVLNNETCTCECVYGLGPNCDQDCVNPSYYVDFDICSLFTAEDCLSPFEDDREMLRESCPATCTCRRHPAARRTNNVSTST